MTLKKLGIHVLLLPFYAIWFVGAAPAAFVLSIAWLYDQTQEKG